jgi:hypothetical protein
VTNIEPIVTVILIASIGALAVGLVTSITVLLPRSDSHERELPMMSTAPLYWSFTIWTVVLGVVMMLAPSYWYGPSWSYFREIPHNGFWMGLCCAVLGSLQLLALWRKATMRTLAVLLFLNGFVFWASGITLGAEGLLGHQGLMEAPFMCYVGAHAYAHSTALWRRSK